ncbi:MAG: hypothetical protein MUC77_04820 [Chromatiaceae bacterium]|nr:hypothetical protein [Chromatiaceae bacterium]
MLTCKRMRGAVILSALLLLTGLALETLAQLTGLAIPTSHLALFAVLAAVGILALTLVASLLPGAAQRLNECQH